MVDKAAAADGTRRRGSGAPVFAALDLGTNNCRLLLAKPRRRDAPSWDFRVVAAFSRITRLGEGLSGSGVLDGAAMDRTIAALKECAELIGRHEVAAWRYVTTEACRRAANGDEFLRRARDEAGLTIEPIPPTEEARLALRGCAPLLEKRRSDVLMFDVGGGSTEIVWAEMDDGGAMTVREVASHPFGVVTVSEDAGGMVEPGQFAAVKESVKARLRPFEDSHNLRALIARDQLRMIGTSGTITTVAAAALDLRRYDRSKVDGLELTYDVLDAASRKLAALSHAERAAHPCIGEGRADLVVAGCAILEAICELWPVGRLLVADRGLREGILMELIEADRNEQR